MRVEGVAELLDRRDSRTIRVHGRMEGSARGQCARCLEPVGESLDGEFDLFFYPASEMNAHQEVALNADDADIGYYEEPGLNLSDAVVEQIQLRLPMRGLCDEGCRGLCPICGANRNHSDCACEERTGDSRWDALKSLKLN